MPIFILEHTENKTSKQLTIEGDRILIGRSPSAEIPLADTGVSKQHLLIERAAGGYTFRDLGSQNGTYVNELRRDEGALRDGDVIRIGRIRITFRLEPPAAAAAPPAAAPEPAAATANPAAPAATAPAASEAASPRALEGGKPEPFDLDGLPVARLAAETEKFPRASVPAPGRRAGRTRSRLHPAAVWSLIAVIGVGVGLGLGILGSYLEKGGDPAGAASGRRAGGSPGASPTDPVGGTPASEDYAPAAGEVAAPPPPGLASFPGLAPDPLGGYASAAESARTLHRLHVDLLGRPPTRAEFRAVLPLAHLERWNRLRPGGTGPARGMADLRAAFLSLLDREPSRQELDYLDAHPGPIENLGLWLTATVEYRSAEHRRDRSLRERARSLIVDLLDRAPESPEEITAVEEAILELPGLAEIARTLTAAGAPAAPAEDIEGWIADEIFRFLQRPPRAGEIARLAEEMKKSPQAPRWLLQTLAQANEYRRY